MPQTKPVFFQSDRRPRWRAFLAGGWIWLRLRYRHNPGFLTAGIAGSIGLVLAILFLLNGQFPLGSSVASAEPEAAGDPLLGEPDDDPPADKQLAAGTLDTNSDPWEDDAPAGSPKVAKSRPFEREADDSEVNLKVVKSSNGKSALEVGRPSTHSERPSLDDDRLTDNDEPSSEEAPPRLFHREIATRNEPAEIEDEVPEEKPVVQEEQKRDELLKDDEPLSAHDEEPAKKPPAERTESKKPGLPLLAADDQEEEPADETPKSQPQATTVVRAAPPAKLVEEETPAADDETFVRPRPASSWKDSKARPLPPIAREPEIAKEPEVAREPATDAVTKSPAVETAVYDRPEPRPTPQKTPSRQGDEPSKLTLEIRSPKYVRSGDVVDLQFIVTNLSRRPVNGAILSVSLPPGLVHPQGSDLEQTIDALAGCQQYRGRMKVKVAESGELSPRADISIGGRIATQTTATLQSGTAREVRSIATDPCLCAPIRVIR